MSSKFRIAIGFAFLLALAFVVPALAGGWAVITLDELPTDVVTGEPLTIGFTVRQHGITLMDGLDPMVTATLPGGDRFVVNAESDDKPGHYTATLVFPKEGTWEWSIQAFSMDQPMPVLHVNGSKAVAGNQAVSKSDSEPASMNQLLALRVVVFGIALVGIALAFQRKSRIAGAFAVLCLVAGIGTFMLGTATPAVEAQGKESSETSMGSSLSQAELGRQLFLAKGCITCHYNSRAAGRNEYLTIDIGAPDLSNYSSHPEILFIRLKDPVAAKSDSKMPNLELDETEIEALVAFINSK